jgi:hypothetical protein
MGFNFMLVKSKHQPTEMLLYNYKVNMMDGDVYHKLGYDPEHEEDEMEESEYIPPKCRH